MGKQLAHRSNAHARSIAGEEKILNKGKADSTRTVKKMVCRDVEICGGAQAVRRAGIVKVVVERKDIDRIGGVDEHKSQKVYAKVNNH